MKKLFLYSLSGFLSFVAFQTQAHACRVLPPNVEAETAGLDKLAVAALNIDAKAVQTITASDKSADYIMTPMCPRGMTAKATYTVAFASTDPLSRGCAAVVKVTKTHARADEQYGGARDHSYKVEVIQDPVCLE
jgi:hypothetical protein